MADITPRPTYKLHYPDFTSWVALRSTTTKVCGHSPVNQTLPTCLWTLTTSATWLRNRSLERLLCSTTAKFRAFCAPSSLTSRSWYPPTMAPNPTAKTAARTGKSIFHIMFVPPRTQHNKNNSPVTFPPRYINNDVTRSGTTSSQSAISATLVAFLRFTKPVAGVFVFYTGESRSRFFRLCTVYYYLKAHLKGGRQGKLVNKAASETHGGGWTVACGLHNFWSAANICDLCPSADLDEEIICSYSPLELHNAKTAGFKVSRLLLLILRFYGAITHYSDIRAVIISNDFFSYFSTPCRDTFRGLDAVQQQLLIGSAVAVGGVLAYMVHKRRQVKTIPLGEGWWGAGKKPLSEDDKIYPFIVETSDEEIKVPLSC